jgi:hypothetical protein
MLVAGKLSLLLLLLFIISSFFCPHRTFAISPIFGLQEVRDSRYNWVQTYGHDSTHLKSDYANILAVTFLSDGKILNATFWLASNLENASTYNQPFKRVSYGVLIDDTGCWCGGSTTGFNGADYEFYIVAANGKWSQYLYQYSDTGNYARIGSKINYIQPFGGSSAVGPGYVKLRLPLSSIDYPSKYSILFYTAESYKSNEVRDFTTWYDIPPSTLSFLTSPSNITIRQGEEQLIPAEVESTSGVSNDVTNITFAPGHHDVASVLNPNGLHVSIQRTEPPLFKVDVPSQTSVGIYNIHLLTSVLEPSVVGLTKPVYTATGTLHHEADVSKKYPVRSIIRGQTTLTINVIPPLDINDRFKNFWGIYGQPISIIFGGFAGGFASLIFGRVTRKT